MRSQRRYTKHAFNRRQQKIFWFVCKHTRTLWEGLLIKKSSQNLLFLKLSSLGGLLPNFYFGTLSITCRFFINGKRSKSQSFVTVRIEYNFIWSSRFLSFLSFPLSRTQDDNFWIPLANKGRIVAYIYIKIMSYYPSVKDSKNVTALMQPFHWQFNFLHANATKRKEKFQYFY